ncbi:RstC protein [Vibrio parahaemolyticus]|nr:RstC protein [Vibrio parahaemolyticus]ELA9815383.1 RstC protein [Vibrio parahaemolyticus]ELA9890142.1 RstC protein [Vibrio parahaemolyticus]
MTVKEYTLSDLESKLNEISNISMFLGTGDCPKEMASNLHEHMHDEIENLQGMLSFMRLYPEIKAQELAQSKLEFDASKPQN